MCGACDHPMLVCHLITGYLGVAIYCVHTHVLASLGRNCYQTLVPNVRTHAYGNVLGTCMESGISVLMPCYVTMYCQAAVWHFVVMSSWLGEARKLAVYGEMLVMLFVAIEHIRT